MVVELITALWTGVEVLCYFLFFGAFLKRSKNILWVIVTFCATWLFILLCVNAVEIEGLSQIGPICIAIAASFVLFKGKWHYHLLSGLGCYFVFAIIDIAVGYGAGWLRGISFSELILQKYAYLTTVTSAKLLELFIAWLIFRTRKKEEMVKLQLNGFC